MKMGAPKALDLISRGPYHLSIPRSVSQLRSLDA
jgi:hypothetical protein